MSDAIKQALTIMPELEDEELLQVASLMRTMSEEQAKQFSLVYKKRRKDSTVSLLLAAAGFLGIAGVHRFYLEQVGMGVLYLLTFGFCMIGTIVDMFNYQSLTTAYNKRKAEDVAVMIRTVIDDLDDRRALPPPDQV